MTDFGFTPVNAGNVYPNINSNTTFAKAFATENTATALAMNTNNGNDRWLTGNNTNNLNPFSQQGGMDFIGQLIQMLMTVLTGGKKQNQPQQANQQNAGKGNAMAIAPQGGQAMSFSNDNMNFSMSIGPDGKFAFAGTGQLPQGNGNDIKLLSNDQLKDRYKGMDKEAMLKDMKNLSPDQIQKLWENSDGNIKAAAGDDIHRRHDSKQDYKTSDGKEVHDPYEVNINGEKFMFVRDRDRNGKIDGKQEVMGINDTKDNLFAEMKSLDANKDGKVSKEEMQTANVKLAKVDDKGQLTNKQFDLNNIDGINLDSLKKTDNKAATGTMATFDLKLANGTTANGVETFENADFFKNLFFNGALQLAS